MYGTIKLKYKGYTAEMTPEAVEDSQSVYGVDLLAFIIKAIDSKDFSYTQRKTFGDRPYVIDVSASVGSDKKVAVRFYKCYILSS